MEPPSRQLIELLTRYGLAKPRDLRRCRPLVRRLARDLPTFDSVWIDALTQTRVLTPFQGKVLESDHPERLEVGPCVLIDEWERDGHWKLSLARHRGSRRQCLLTFINVSSDGLPRARDGVRDLLAGLRGLSHPSIIVPQGCDELNERLVVVSPYVSGPTLQQLLVRRGRFPIGVVIELARQLLDALATLERSNVVHGDLRLTSLRLTSGGQVILLNPGVLPAVGQRVSFHDSHVASAYDGIAPELISTGQTATLSSDLYALGCLLWQLLSGRPPFPTGDPLAKLAAHQTRPIDDVRRWRPDAPEVLAKLIAKLTQKEPQQRPSGPQEVRDTLKLGLRTSRASLRKFHASFGAVAARHGDTHRSASRFPFSVAAMLVFVLSGLSLSLLDAGARNELLRLATRVSVEAPSQVSPQAESTRSARQQSGLLPFPTESVDGVIELTSAGPYAPGVMTSDRPLTIRAADGVRPTIIVGQQPHHIAAQSVHLQGIRFVSASHTSEESSTRDADSAATTTPVLMAVRTQQLVIEDCTFDRREAGGMGTAIAWKVLDEADPAGGRFVARQSLFYGSTRAVDLHALSRVIGFDNCLKLGDGPLLRMSSPSRSTPLRVHLRQTTLRESGGVILWTSAAAEKRIQPTLVVLEDSVFALDSSTQGLLEFAEQSPVGWERLMQITGEGSLLRPETPLAVSQGVRLDDSRLRIEGLISDDFEFADEDSTPTASVVVATQAPRSTPTLPGIDPARFPMSDTAPLVRQASHEYNTP